MSGLRVRAAMFVLGVLASSGSASSSAQVAAAPTGCPQFHCTPEASGVVSQPIVGSPALAATITLSEPSLGTLLAQGCSGDGTLLACLVDPPADPSGRLKVLDTTARPTMAVIASDAMLPPSKRLGRTWSNGQVPFVFADGRIGAGDARSYNIYDFTGPMPKATSAALPAPVPPGATTMGLTDLGNGYGVVSRTDGVLTFIDMQQGTAVGSLALTGASGEMATLASVPSASNGVLYAVANGDSGYLFAVSMEGGTVPATWNWRYAYSGNTGASPVEVTPFATGYSNTLVLLHVPATESSGPQLQGLIDNGSSATVQWYIPLAVDLTVSPVVDELDHKLYLVYKNDDQVFGYPLYVDGPAPAVNAEGTAYDLEAMTGLSSLQINGHLAASQSGPAQDFTLLVAAKATSGGSSSEYMIALRPSPAPGSAWSTLISPEAARYIAAWNLSPSSTPGIYCPLVVEGGSSTQGRAPAPNGLVLMCDH